MCGFAGIYHYADQDRHADRALLERMTRCVAHRGPDDEGFLVAGPLALGHRRLSIVDLSVAGHQPMQAGEGAAWLAYNGEFYDHRRHRAALAADGVRFRGESDTETMVHLLRARGPSALGDTAGIFALAYWEPERRTLVLARDPMGVKQLYVYDDGSTVYFASEIKALLGVPGLPREIDPQAVSEYLHFHTPIFDRTFLRAVRQVRAGEYLTYGPRGARATTYWQLGVPGGAAAGAVRPDASGAADEVEALRGMLTRVIGEQLMSDVPVGAFFSGGIDSSAVASYSARLGKPPLCFGVHFSGQGVIDERPYQEAAARALGLELHLTTLGGETFPDDLGRLLYQQDQPVIGAAMFPMDAVCRLAASHVKVCLGGQAADELFGGYARYALTEPWRAVRGLVRRRSRGDADAAAGGPVAGRVTGNLWKQATDPRVLRRLLRGAVHAMDWRTRYFENFAKVPEARWHAVFADPAFVARADRRQAFMDGVAAAPVRSPAARAMHWDARTYLTGLFQQDDRMSMGWSLESRVPLADPRMAQFAFTVPTAQKIRDGSSKWILRQAVADVLPEFVLNRRKVGFDTPAERWMREEHAGFVRETLTSAAARGRGIWRPEGIEALLAAPHQPYWFDVAWKALCIEVWATRMLDEVPAAARAR